MWAVAEVQQSAKSVKKVQKIQKECEMSVKRCKPLLYNKIIVRIK